MANQWPDSTRQSDRRRREDVGERFGEWPDEHWDRLTHQLRSGECTPFLGAGACFRTLPSGGQLSRRLAKRHGYPYRDRDDLAAVSDWLTWKFDDTSYVKYLVCRELSGGPPDFGNPLEPHRLLADLPIPVYITTNYDSFLFQALRYVGKAPHQAICPWHSQIDHSGELLETHAGWNPQPEAPLVYHLHGRLEQPASMVLTSEDYDEFSAALVRNQSIIPPVIRKALTARSLLFIGYGMRDTTFRMIFKGLQTSLPGIVRKRHVSIMLRPKNDHSEGRGGPRTMEYYAHRYEQWRISIYWGTIDEFSGELRRRLGQT
ncbi:SIR2 family NAD-dependent protein deacylase [[Actinomadura] parvosata]|uniref:SIR2 family NAD-dependent protein deacylase n=1 Tax=[Actinomadura] parvosata TaxID=1955412 RepID=UPI00406C5B70